MRESKQSRTASGLKDILRPLFPPNMRTVILGVGSELRRDDYAGMAVTELMHPYGGDDVLIVGGGSAPENLTGEIRRFKPDSIIVIDAAHMGANVGEYFVIDPHKITGSTFCTHMLPLPVMLSYLEAVCGCTSAYIGIEPSDTGQGIGMDTRVSEGVKRLAAELAELLRKSRTQF